MEFEGVDNMANIQLQPDELVTGHGMMAYWEPVLGSACNVWRGTIFVTNQRVCFCISWTAHMEVELRLSEIRGFTVGRHLFATKVTIHSKSGKRFTFTGFPVKKLQVWLRSLGIPQLK
jgi:hypothetical protein